jgi:hypothetical protein
MRVVHSTGKSARMDPGRKQNRVGDGDRMTWKGATSPRYAQDKVWKRLRLKAKQTRHYSPAAAAVGTPLTQVVKASGGSWVLARTWPGGRDLEYRLKRWHSGVKLCPTCQGDEHR